MPEQTNSLEGACKRFECKVIGFPRPSIRWYKDGENITTHRRYQFDYTPDGCIVLIIDKVAPSDQGVYECRAENSAGSAETSALLHVRGEVLGDYDDPISVHSMSFRLLDSQKRPLILEQKRHDSAELSEDSVIDIRSDIANTKLEINGELDQSVANLNDESLNVWTDSNIDNTKDNYDNRLAEALAEIGNTENPRSRHWTADSGITSLGSSFSSEPDININHDSMLEMQRYLHGNPDDSCKPFTEETLNDTGTFFTETSKTECVSDKTEKVLDQNLIDKEVVENPKMANCDIAVLAYEFYQEDDIGHHLCTSKQNHVDHIEANIDWEKVDDHDASILAGKYLFAHGRDAQASDDIHPLSEWEMTKQVDRSQLISAGQFEDQLKKVTEEVQKQTIVETESSEQTFIKDSQMKNTATEADDIDGNLISTLNGEINGHRAENDFVTAEKRQQYFTANLQEESKYENKSEHLESMLDLNKKDRATVMNNDDELIEHSVSSSVKTEEQKHCLSENMRFSKLKTEQSRHLDASDDNNEIIVTDHIYESASSSDELMVSADTDESFDLDIDRSEQTITKRSQQYRRPSAQDDLTSEMVDQLATKETLSGNDKGIWLDAEIKTENYNKLEEAIELSQSLSEKCNEKLKAVDKDQTTMEGTSEAKAHAALNELDNLGHGLAETEWSDDDAYDLDLDRSEQLMIKKSQQFRRPSAKDSLTSEIIDDLSATQKLTPSNDAMSIGSESCQMKCSNNSSHSDDNFDLDVDRKEEAILARRSSLRKHQTQEMDTANMELDTVQQINSRSSVEKNEVLELRENIKEPKDGCDNSIHDSHDVNTTKDKNISDSMSDGENLETGASQQQNMLSDSLDDKKRDGISIDEHKGIPKTAEQSPEISQTLLTGEIVVQKETDFNFETVENLTTHTDGNSKSKTVPFEKLSSAEKDEILKQISDVSLLNGRRNRQLKEKSDRYNVNSESTNENDVPTETENETDESNINETAVLISDVNDSEKIKQAAVIEKQISRTDENEDTMDRTEVDSLEMQDSDNYQTPTLTTVNEQNDNKTILHKKKCDEYRVDEIMLKPQRDHEPPDVEMLETSPVRNALVSAEATTLFEKLELGSAEYLYQAEQLSDEKAPSRTSIDNDDLEMLDDTKPEVPNIINSIENVSSKTDLKCQTEEVLAFQEENRPLLTETNLTEIDGMNLNKIEKAVSKEESNLIIQEISISNEAIIVETPDHKDNSIEDKTKMKSNREHVPIVNEQIEQQSSQDVADDLNMDVEETFSETKVEELELRQTVDQITKADVMDTLLDKPSDLAEQMNNENATHGFKKELGNDEVDADKSCNQSQDIVIKAPVLEPGANQDDIEEETLLIEKNEITQHDGTARSDERLKSNEKDAAEQTVLPETGKEKPDEVSQKTSKPKIQAKTEDITIDENEPITLEWMITGVSTSEVGIIKDGLKVQPNDRISIQSDSGRLSLHIDSALVEDAAVYSITDGNSNDAVEAILVEVTALEALGEKRDEDKTEPAFVVEPVVAKEDDGRRMSIKCSVSGFPQPDVTWYHHGQPLGTGEFWDVYSKDGYHYLANSGSEFLDSEEIVCRVENDLGYIQTVLQLKKEGGEITCKPVQKEALCPDLDETSPAGPRVELQLTETNTKGLLPYTVTAPHTDKDNKVTVNEGEIVQLLGTYDTQQWITRHTEKSSKICYVPKHLLQACVAADVSRKECKNVARNQITEQINKTTDNTELQTPDTQDTPSASTMPERRKIVPGSKLHGTQEDGKDRDQSPTDIESKLGFKENLDKKKDVSDHTLPEYEDGTSRPMFKKRLKTVVTRTGELCQMECIVRGTPLPKVLWLKNNRPLKESDGCQVIADEETNMLVFPEVGKDDVGVYTARAMNVNGSVMSSAELTLEDGRPIPYSETSESPMDLDFTTPSYFFQMSSCQVAEGRLARFDCRVVAYPRPEIVWMRDGKVVESEGRYQLLNVNNEIYSLLIQDVQMSDTGRYTCWARNKFGEAMTEAYLNVIALTEQEEEGDMAPKFLTRFYDQQTTEGMPTDFRCLIAGKPAPSVTWLLDDIELKDSSAVRQRQKDSMVSLEMKSPKVDQSGQYTCQLRNPLGEATCSAKLTVIEDRLHGRMLPKFLRKFDHLTIKDGEEAKFSCVVVGEPKADIVWMFDHKPIPDSNRRFIRKRDGDTYSLIVKTARLDDAGVITCKAVNDEGEVYCSANLHVRESKYGRETPERLGLKPEQKESKLGYVPTFTKRLQDVEVSEGSTAKFECKVMGIPEPEVTWMKDGRVIQPGGRYHMVQDGDTCYLQIDNVAPSDTGVYTCILSNNQGKSSSSAALKMEGVPPKDKYVPEKPLVDTYAKKERYTPDRKIEDTYTRKTRYTPERYLEDMYTKKGRYTPERYLEDTYAKKRYTPERYFEDTYAKQRYTPDRYDDTYAKKSRYAPDYLEDTYVKRYTPDRYSVPESYSQQTALKQPYLPSEMKTEAVPKIAYDKPMLLHKTDESVRLSWTPVSTHNLPADSRRVSYVVESRELPSSNWTKIGYNVPGSSYLVRNLRPDKEYEFRVRAQNQHGISEPTRPATLEKRIDDSRKYSDLPEMRAPPRLPTHRPIITDLGEEMVRLAWRPVETYKSKRIPPVSYQVEAKELPGKDWMPISTRLRDTTHYLSELEPDRDYLFRVRAENDFGVSEPTEPLWLPRARVFPGVPISRPQIVEIEPHKAKLSWARVDVPAFGLEEVPLTYMLEVEEPPKDWRTLARDLDDTEYIIEGLKPEHDYRFRVRAKTPTGVVSEPSPAVSLYTTLAQIRAPVDRLEVLDYEPDTRSVNLSWQRVEVPPYSSEEEPLMYMLEYQEPPLPDWRPLVTGIPTTRYRVMHLDPDRDYKFRVKALTPYGVSLPSPALPVTMRQPPTAIRHLPEEVTISEVEPDSLRLTWRRPMVDLVQPMSYQIEMMEPLVSDWRPVATRVTDTTYKVTGLKPTRDYQFRVIPYADTRALASTPVVGLTSSPVRPRLHLSEPKIREMGPESVQLSWQPAVLPLYQRSRTPIHYGVEMMELPSTTWVPVARRVPDTKYLVSGLKPDRDYKFRVTAETDLATSEPSLAAILHRKPAPVFPRDEPTIRDFTPSAIMLSWQPAVIPEGISLPVSTPVFYSVESQSPPGMGVWSTLYARHPTPSVKLSDLRPDLDYLVRVRAHYNDFVSEPTLPVYIPRRAAPPRIPHEEPYPVDIGSDSVKLQWRSADLPVHIMDYAPVTYRIEAQELPGGNWVTVARGIPHTDFKVTGLSPKNDYCFRIRAENDYGVSDPTRPVTVGRRAVGPTLPSDKPLMYDLGPGSVRLSWRPATVPSFAEPTSPVTYTIFVQELPFKTWRPHVKRVPQTWYHISGLSPDKEYNFRVQAENEFGTSKPTQAVYMPRITDLKRPISMPEIDDFDEDLTSVKLHWKPRAGPPFDMGRSKYLIESWEPVRREWFPVAKGIPDTSYQLSGLPAAQDHLFRVRLETEAAGLSEPSVPVSVSRFYPKRPVYRPQLYELDTDSVRLSWEPAFIPSGQTRRPIRYIVEMREIPDKAWSQIASDLLDTNYKIRGLRAKYDYEFRVRALIDGEASEPSMPVPLYRRPGIPKVRFDVPEVYDVEDHALSLRWNKVDVPAFSYDDEPLSFMIERQTLPGYQWEPVATNLTGTSYRVHDLQPYQDYAFRVRGVYPSGYTEPSPHVPVYRRPSESKLSLASRIISSSDSLKLQLLSNQNLPSQSLRSSLPSEFSPLYRKVPREKTSRSYSYSPERRYSVPESLSEIDYRTATVTEKLHPSIRRDSPGFRLKDAYVYKRRKPEDIIPTEAEFRPKHSSLPKQMSKVKRLTSQFEGVASRAIARRHSDVGLGVSARPHSAARVESSKHYDSVLEERKIVFRDALMYKAPKARSSSVPKATDISTTMSSSYQEYPYRSVADRYEDIKLKHIMKSKMPPRSVSLDTHDYKKYQDLESVTRPSTYAPSLSRYVPASHTEQDSQYYIDYMRPEYDYYDGTYFIIEDEMNLNYKMPLPRVSRFDMKVPASHRSISYDREPGYFMISKFSLVVSGVRHPGPAKSTKHMTSVRTQSLEPSLLPRTRSRSNTPAELLRSRVKARSLTPDFDLYKDRSRSESVVRSYSPSVKRHSATRERKRAMSFTPETIQASAVSKTHEMPVVKPRSNSISVPAPTRQTKASDRTMAKTRAKAAILIDQSKSLIDRYGEIPSSDTFTMSRSDSLTQIQPPPLKITTSSQRRPSTDRVRLSVPIARPEVWEEEPYSARLRWQRAYIPPYYSSVPLRYRIEMQEAGPTTSDWRPVATDVTTPDFTVNELSPRKDYNFRIRAEMENGDISEPTPPIQYYRSQLPMSKEPFTLAEYKPVDYEVTFANRTYVEHLTKFVPPRLPIDKPEMVVINPETVELAWKPARVPESIRHSSNLTYTIEVRTPPCFEWRELVSGLKGLNSAVKKLHPKIDYIFRIRAWNEYGCSEPSLPVSLYRPAQHEADASFEEDEAFEREWELRFGQQVPPKLPMDTPKIITQSPEALWFSWIPARIPAYATQTPITYIIEVKEPPETSWNRPVKGVVDCQYTYEGMNPTRDYHIRVRAETQFGLSEPTLPIIIKRGGGSRPGSRRSSLERDMKSDDVTLDTTVIDSLTSGVPPRMASNRPLSSNAQPTSLTLSWPAARVPAYVKNARTVYIIEKREPPGHLWSVLAKDITETKYDIRGLNAEQDYMFRVRAKNEFGTSEPTLPMTLYRERDDYVPQKIRSRSGSRDSIQALVSRRRRSSSFDFLRAESEELDAIVQDKIPTQPEYTSTPKWDTQYGVEGKKGKIVLQVRGYPLPTVHWYLNDEKLDYGDNYNAFVSPSGTVTLEIKLVTPDTIGTYKCFAENESGSAVKFVKYEFADPPTVLEPLRDLALMTRTSGRLTCRVDGFPSPSAKWMKDWHPVKDSSRIKVIHEAPDTYCLEITNALSSDTGLYACTMENTAGKVTMTARLVVEDQEPGPVEVELKKSNIEDAYHILEEIGRSKQGVIRRVIEKQTGESYAANFIFARNKAQKNFFMTEFEILRLLNQYDNILKLHDAFETERSLILVTELISGTDLLDKVIADGNWTEAQAADAVKKLLGILEILGSHNIQHLDIKPSNIYLCGPEGKDMKLMNFALSQQLVAEEEIIHNYGSIGYASPEQVGEDLITDRTDMWGVGVLAYILLSGESPFPGTNDFEILNKMKTCDWGFGEAFVSFSEEAKDFISKLLLKNPSDRLSVEDCLKHPWLKTTSDKKLHIEKLNSFYESDKQKREASKSFITANLQSFNKILHGASALYQPAMDQESGEIIFPDTEEYGDFLSEDAWYEWQLHFMDDPDTQSFPLDNKDFTVRESRHTAGEEDSQDDKKDAGLSMADSAIMFRNKIQTTSFVVGEDVTFTCTVISPNCPAVVTWYRDEQLLSEDTYRTEAKYSEETGEASLKLTNLKDYDAAVYKCVARNKDGRVSCEARLLLGDTPGKPGRPVITQTSGSEVFLTWTGPVSDGNSYILGYRIDFKKTGDEKWTRGPFVTEEYALVSGLAPSSEYIFRISCHNKYGAGQYSWASLLVTTGNVETPKIELAKYLRPLLKFSSYDKQQLILQAASRRPSLTVVADATSKEGKPEESYSVLETVSKGSYGEYKLCSSKANNKQYITKVMPFSKDNQDTVMYEFNILSRLRQVNIVTVFESFIDGDKFYVIFEKLSGINVVQYLCLRKFYSEDTVCRIVRQILDGLQYLQQVGIAHLNLQPSSVVMATKRRLHVKLRDFTLARKIENGKEEKVSLAGYPDFIAPEILRGEPAEFAADVWGLGVLAFVLLSGTSPFGGTDLQETLNKIVFDRYNTCDMYDNVSKEAISFVRKMLKRLPRNRTTVVKCLDSRWLQLTDSMTKTRNGHLFRTETLRDFLTLYTERKGDKQYMDMSVITGESLAKPMIGPATEPVLSKKIPKYAKPVIKSSQDTKSDLDSIETIASDFKSVLDKIDKLRTALESGSEIPEWETTTMKPGGFDTPKLVARKVTEEKLKDTIQTTEVDSTCLNTSESGGKVGILYETGKAEKSDSLVSKDYKLAKSAESSVAVETKSESSKAFETENKLDLTTKANENKAHKSDLEMNKDIESTAEKPETFKMSGENNDTKHEALEQLNQAATQNDASIEHVTVEKSGHNSVANSKAKIADEFFTVSGMDTEKEKQNTQFKGLKETSMKADEKVSDTEANTLSVNKMKIQKQKDENRSFPKQKTEEKIQTENDVASKHDSGSQHEDENKETRPKKLSGLKDKKQIPPKAVENIISTSTDTNPQLNEKSACETTDKELKVIPSHSAEVDKEHMKSSDKGGSNEAEHKKFIDQQQENTEINSKPQTESTAKTTESYKETQETKQDTAAGNNMETVVSKKSGSQQDLEKTNQKIIEEIKESVVKEQEKYEIDLKQKNESTVKTKEASNDMKEVEQKLVQKHAAADIIEESSESKKSDSQQVLSETNQKTVEEVIECVTRTQEMAEIDLKQKTVSNAQEEKALKEMQEVEQKTVKEHVAADIDKDTLSKKPDSKQVMSETDQGIKTMQKEQTEHNENSIKTEEVLEKRETVEQITVQDNMSDDINAEAAIGNTPYCQQAVSETNQEIVEEIVECVARKKDNAVPNMEILKQKENINGNLELNSEGKAEEEKISTKESQSKVVDKVENAKERVDIVDKEPMLTEHNIQETCPAEEIAEELIEAKVAKKDKALPNLDIKEKNNQKQDKTKEELFQADKSTDNKQSKISDESNFQCEFETDKVKPNTETGHQTILKENEISSVVSEGTHSNASTVGQNLSDSNSSEQTGLNAQELKDSNVNSSIEIPNELKNYCDSSKEHIISSNANEADRKKFEVTSDMIEESERCLNDLSEEDKRRSMSTISTVSESEYLDALSCSDHKDIKCIHESTPDSAYVTPDRDIPKPDPVVEEEANKNVEITEKSDTEPVKEREDNSAGLKDQEIGTNIGTTTDTVGVNTEKDLVSADVEQMAERLVLEAMDDALKVAEKTE